MAIISISRGSSSRGREVAERVASRLDCRCLAREDVIRDADLTQVDETEIIRALDEPPSFLDRLLGGRAHYVATARAALLAQLSDDHVVYHGFAGHFFLKDIAHALKVRVLAEKPDRVATAVKRDGISEAEAEEQLARLDAARRQWALRVCGVDPEDPTLYDIVLNVGKLGADDVSEIICGLSEDNPFRSTEATQKELQNLALTAAVEAVLIEMEIDPDSVDIDVEDGNVTVRVHTVPRTRAGSSGDFSSHYLTDLRHRLHQRAKLIPGLKAVHLEHSL